MIYPNRLDLLFGIAAAPNLKQIWIGSVKSSYIACLGGQQASIYF